MILHIESSDWDQDRYEDQTTFQSYEYDTDGNVSYHEYRRTEYGMLSEYWVETYEYDANGEVIYRTDDSDWDGDEVF